MGPRGRFHWVVSIYQPATGEVERTVSSSIHMIRYCRRIVPNKTSDNPEWSCPLFPSLPFGHSAVRSFALWVRRELLKGFVQFVTEVVGRSFQMAIGARN